MDFIPSLVWVHLRYGQTRARLKLMEDCRQHKILCFRIEYTKTKMWGNKRRLGMENHPKLLSSRVVSQSIEGIWGEQESMARAFFLFMSRKSLSFGLAYTFFFFSTTVNFDCFLPRATIEARKEEKRVKLTQHRFEIMKARIKYYATYFSAHTT